MHHQIVALELQHQPLPVDGFDFPHTLTTYQRTSTREELHERIRDATVVITTTVKLDAATLHADVTPNLQYIAVSATGTDPVDLAAAKARGIRVTNCPGAPSLSMPSAYTSQRDGALCCWTARPGNSRASGRERAR
jgi:lactate dehydrogenase-like 2-hydroxyacid dehydrogenase